MKITVVGAGRAGTSFFLALGDAGHDVALVHHEDRVDLAGQDVVILCVPDDALEETSHTLARGDYVVAHVAGSRGLEVLAPHARVASLHPLVALPSGRLGARRLRGATYCVAGDALVREVVASLDGHARTISDADRSLYHATATVAANHVVALLGQVSELAERLGLSMADFLPLARQALEDVERVGPVEALTGPASRGDVATIDAHLNALPEAERAAYVAMAHVAFELAERRRSQQPA
ncbi:MAG TPA: DUF2520 domain-containing protein [Acidimicrobiales bacterium]|nr:DUF2520 domain-containing protein [Acidimicrobiales bacterium]